MEYLYFFLIVVALVGALLFIRRLDNIAKNRYRQDAYKLLEDPTPDPVSMKKTLKGLHLYGGRWRKDQEFQQLIRRLSDKLDGFTG